MASGIPVVVGATVAKNWREDPRSLVGATVDYANAVVHEGHYTRSELPQEVMQAFHCDYYPAQVRNGGYRQFFHNNGAGELCFADVSAGLKAIGATPHLSVFSRAVEIFRSLKPEDASDDSIPTPHRRELEALDTQFFERERSAPISEALARWIASWPSLKLVDDGKITKAYADLALKNPNRQKRMEARNYARLCHGLSDISQFALGYAAAATRPEPEFILGIGAGRSAQINGQSRTVVSVQTNVAQRLCTLDQHGIELFATNQNPVGDRLSALSLADVERGGAICQSCNAGPAAALLLKRAGLDPARARVSYAGVFDVGTEAVGLLISGYDAPLTGLVLLQKGSAQLSSLMSKDTMCDVTSAEIKAYMEDMALEL